MGTRLLFVLLLVTVFSSMAFAGPSVVISDPYCSNDPHSGEIPLYSGDYSFSVSGPTTLTFCNATDETTFRHLNFAISFGSAIDISSIYCGGPDTPYGDSNQPSFDYCAVLDPNKTNITGGKEPFSNQDVTGKLIHEFVIANGDTPSGFTGSNHCYYGCNDEPGTGPDITSLVYLSFNLVPPVTTFAPTTTTTSSAVQKGLLPGRTFSITLDCGLVNDPNCSDDLFKNANFTFNVDSDRNSTDFPTPVPEPATLTLLATAAIPALLRRRKKT